MGNGIFWSEIGSGFGDAGGTPPPKIPRSTPPGINPYGTRKNTTQIENIRAYLYVKPSNKVYVYHAL